MNLTLVIFQVVVALGLINVWLVRYNRATAYRGGNAQNMSEEFMNYGLPKWSTYLVGALKLSIAAALIAGIWVPALIAPAATTLLVLMIGAIAMHIRVRDPIKKSIPALIMLSLSTFILLGHSAIL